MKALVCKIFKRAAVVAIILAILLLIVVLIGSQLCSKVGTSECLNVRVLYAFQLSRETTSSTTSTTRGNIFLVKSSVKTTTNTQEYYVFYNEDQYGMALQKIRADQGRIKYIDNGDEPYVEAVALYSEPKNELWQRLIGDRHLERIIYIFYIPEESVAIETLLESETNNE